MAKGVTAGEFFLNLVVDAGKGELTLGNLVSSMGELEVASVGEIAILQQLAKSLEKITDAAIKNAIGFTDYASATGASTEELQKWQNAARHVNVSASTTESVLRRISHDLATGALSGDFGGLKNLSMLFTRAHISLQDFKKEKPEELLNAIRRSAYFQGLPNATQEAILSQSDLAPMLNALRTSMLTAEEFKKFAEEGEIMPKESIKKWMEIHSEFTSIAEISERIGGVVAHWFSDDLQDSLKMTIKLLGQAADLIDPKVKKPEWVELSKRVLGDILYPPNAAKDIYGYGKNIGNSLGQITDPRSYMEGGVLSPTPASVMAGAGSGIGPQQVHHNYHATVNGSKLNQRELTDAMEKMFHDLSLHSNVGAVNQLNTGAH